MFRIRNIVSAVPVPYLHEFIVFMSPGMCRVWAGREGKRAGLPPLKELYLGKRSVDTPLAWAPCTLPRLSRGGPVSSPTTGG